MIWYAATALVHHKAGSCNDLSNTSKKAFLFTDETDLGENPLLANGQHVECICRSRQGGAAVQEKNV